MRRIGLLLLVLGALAPGCGSDGSKASTTGSGSSSSSTNAVVTTSIPKVSTTASTSTTAPAATSTTTTAPTTTTSAPAPATAELAAKGLVERWGAGDRDGAAQFATADAIDTLFATDGAGNTWMFQGCDGVAGGAVCSFSFEGGGTNMHVQNLGTIGEEGFRVDGMNFIAD